MARSPTGDWQYDTPAETSGGLLLPLPGLEVGLLIETIEKIADGILKR